MLEILKELQRIFNESIKYDNFKYYIDLIKLSSIIPLIDSLNYCRKHNNKISMLISRDKMDKLRDARNFASHPFGFEHKIFDVKYLLHNVLNIIEYPEFYVYNKKLYYIDNIILEFNKTIGGLINEIS